MKNFFKDESGVVTADWVVLTAAVCALAFAVISPLYSGTAAVGNKVGTALDGMEAGDQ